MAARALNQQQHTVIVIGASGVIGKRLVAGIKEKYKVVAALRKTPLPEYLIEGGNVICEMGVDLRDYDSVENLVRKYSDEIYAIWNLAAPLSVESENDPSAAEDTTVGGMTRLIQAMDKCNVSENTIVCFSDSIGSYGLESPRNQVDAAWLTNHQDQDPGSEYGRQKRKCRDILQLSKYDTRWGIIPGVLHDDNIWGDGTTEYALSVFRTYYNAYYLHGERKYICPIHQTSMLPMIHVSDLIIGLIALMETDISNLNEPSNGYAFAGFSFTPRELFDKLKTYLDQKKFKPESRGRRGEEENLELSASNTDFDMVIEYDTSGPAALFAELWPNSISGKEALRDLGWKPVVVPTLEDAIHRIMSSHEANST